MSDAQLEAERQVAELHEAWTRPRERECLTCYIDRMLAEFGCDNTLRWARRWRDICAPRAVALERRLEARGGFCDCEVLFNVYPERLPEDDATPMVPCSGVGRRSSTKPCVKPLPARHDGVIARYVTSFFSDAAITCW